MKASVLLLLSLLLFSCSNNKVKNDLTKANLKGRIKTLVENCYCTRNEFGELHKTKLTQKSVFRYDVNGKETEEIKYDEDGLKKESKVFSYNNNGCEVEWNLFSEGKVDVSCYNKYDSNGNRLMWINHTMKSRFSDGGTVYNKDTLMKFDHNNNLIESSVYSRVETNGDNIGYNEKYKNYSLSEKYAYVYDNKNNLIQLKHWVANIYGNFGEPQVSYDKYDGKNNIIESDFSGANYKIISKYNDNNEKTEERTIIKNSGEVKTELFKYENHDKACNWLKQIDSRADGVTYILEREIEYY